MLRQYIIYRWTIYLQSFFIIITRKVSILIGVNVLKYKQVISSTYDNTRGKTLCFLQMLEVFYTMFSNLHLIWNCWLENRNYLVFPKGMITTTYIWINCGKDYYVILCRTFFDYDILVNLHHSAFTIAPIAKYILYIDKYCAQIVTLLPMTKVHTTLSQFSITLVLIAQTKWLL